MSLQTEAIQAIQTADFREFWPTEVRRALVRAAKHDDGVPFPPYAERLVRRSLKEARAIERRMAKDIEVGEAALSQADRKRLVSK